MAEPSRVVSDPKIMYGKPVIRGTRIPVETLLRLLGQGQSEADVLAAYPGLTKTDLRAAQAFAAEYLAGETVRAAE